MRPTPVSDARTPHRHPGADMTVRSATPASDRAELGRLGHALAERAGEVLERVRALAARDRAPELAGPARSAFARICVLATVTVGRCLAADGEESDLQAGRASRELFAALAADDGVSKDQLTERVLHWGEAVEETFDEIARALAIEEAAVARANTVARMTLELTLVRMCEAVDAAGSEDEVLRRRQELAFLATHPVRTIRATLLASTP